MIMKGWVTSSTPINEKLGVNYMYLYTDIIQPSNFGNQWGVWETSFSLDGSGDNSPNW